jgi:photosystem II stability/assembly factor-like uncharacterized protein
VERVSENAFWGEGQVFSSCSGADMSARNLPYGMAVGFLTAFLLTSIPPCTGRADSARVIGSLFASAVISDDRFVIVGDRGRIFLSEDGAKTWTLVDSGTK